MIISQSREYCEMLPFRLRVDVHKRAPFLLTNDWLLTLTRRGTTDREHLTRKRKALPQNSRNNADIIICHQQLSLPLHVDVHGPDATDPRMVCGELPLDEI